jgi:hypothetical protein
MLSATIANNIVASLAENERYEDFAYLFEALLWLRRPFHENLELSEAVVGRIVCLLAPDKPRNYVRAMQQFRVQFRGVSTDAELQGEFSNCTRNAAIIVRQPKEVVFRPSLYFSPSERLLKSVESWF